MSEGELAVIQRNPNALMQGAEKNALSVVDQMSKLTLITPNDVKNLERAQQFILSTYTDVHAFRPLVVKLASVLNDGTFPTPDAKYWQCKKEAEVHFNQMVTEMYKYERAMVDVEEMDYMIASLERSIKEESEKTVSKVGGIDPEKAKFELKRLKIKREEYIFNMKLAEKTIKYRIQEINEWAAISDDLRKNCKYDTNNFNAHLAQNMYEKLSHDIANSKEDAEKQNYAAQLATLKRLIEEASRKQQSA